MNTTPSTHVLIIGAGFSGGMAAVRLAGRARGRVRVTVVNPRPTFVNRLRLHHVAIGRQVAAPSIREMLGSDAPWRTRGRCRPRRSRPGARVRDLLAGVRRRGATPWGDTRPTPLDIPEVAMKVVVIGALGKVSRHLLPLLAKRGDDVVGVVRKPEQLDEVADLGADPLLLDVESASTDRIAMALDGVDAVVWSAGAGGGNPERTYAVDRDAAIRSMDAGALASAPRYVMVSWIGSVPDHGVPEDSGFYAYADAKLAADEHLRGTQLDWTILGPGTLTDDDATGMIERVADGVSLARGQASAVPRADVAQVVAATLHEPQTIGKFVRFRSGQTPIADALRD